MRLVVLYRDDGIWTPEEHAAASRYFDDTTCSRMDIREGDLVIGRYSVLPYYKEQERDINLVGARLINTYRQHRYVADMWNWYEDLSEFTPRTWARFIDIPQDVGPLVIKGETNSRKHLWDTHMFAPDREAAKEVMRRLMDDSLIGSQNLYFREFENFETLSVGIRNIPITTEFRFFVCNERIISGAYYWSSNTEDLKDLGIDIPNPDMVPSGFLDSVIQKIGRKVPFYVLDVAKRVDGEWRVVELNDGQMSGLSDNTPEILYRNLHKVLEK